MEAAIAKIIGWIPALLGGAKITILLTIASVGAGTVFGLLLALGKISKNVIINKLSSVYIFFFRGTPLLMQLYFLYFGLPKLFPALTLRNKFLAAFIAFTVSEQNLFNFTKYNYSNYVYFKKEVLNSCLSISSILALSSGLIFLAALAISLISSPSSSIVLFNTSK